MIRIRNEVLLDTKLFGCAIYFRWDWRNWTIGLWIERGLVRGHLLCLSLSLEK